MSDEKKPERTVESVRQEYNNLAARFGHLEYTIRVHQDDADLIFSQMKDLQLEGAQLIAQKELNNASQS